MFHLKDFNKATTISKKIVESLCGMITSKENFLSNYRVVQTKQSKWKRNK